ncbi:flavin reductase [Lawsonibacter sp. OA9]|uniref:flavin reductase n=1 Tax=Oscillospiraceae TaxID=216572 RepID=UPI0008208790|nr:MULTISPECIES: flavin reductase [Oscillospiraceae]MBS5589683.1 flavin reductase [Clostridiales bacterium]SCH86334.1 Nitric oxide reductase NADH:FprA oxidoreductase [uncultured Clostridium sp.]SCI64273.1 Nitric oxide reductase NADH:FprA oxidoreductase [uncultured Flavonifractor sp.]MCH1980546.1 flavin reductase [Lawsonibacter sp. OA9]MCU6701543.1 flavin reductase [Muriventricola aceti]
MNRKAFSRINYGLFIVGAELDGKPQGCIVNSLHQVTSSMPFKFSLTVNKSNETFKAIEAKGSFAATVLAKDTPKDLVNLFGYKSGRVVNKFDGFDVERDGAGNPYVKDHALARFSCKVVEKLDLGTYMLYIAETMEAEVLGEGPALTVDDFKNDGGSTPPTATVVRTLEGNEGWRCTICGYVAEKETLPDGYQCPICRANKDKFVKL